MAFAFMKHSKYYLIAVLFLAYFFLNPRLTFAGEQASQFQGLKFFQQGQYQKAQNEFNRILETDPSNATAHYYLGLTLGKQNQHKESIPSFKKALELDPSLTDAYLSLGISYFKIKSYDLALKELQNALRADPNNTSANFFAGLIYQEKGKHSKAIPYFEKSMSGDKDFNQMALYNLGVSYDKMGDKEKARSSFNKAIELDPQSEMAGNSKKFLAIMAEKPQKKNKRWGIEVSTGLEWDDNVTRVEQDAVTGETDIAGVFEFEGSFKILDEPKYDLEASYDFFQTLYEDITTFNFQSHGGTLSASGELGRADVGGSYNYTFTTLDADDFLAIQSVTPSLGFSHSQNQYTYLSYIFQDKNFFTDDNRDGNNHSIGVDHFIFFMDAKGYVLVNYRVETESTFGDEFEYIGHQAKLGLKAPLPFDSLIKASYRFNFRDYDNVTPSIAREREDNKHTFKVELSKEIFKNVNVKAKYEYIDSGSNLPSVDFTENIAQISLEFSDLTTSFPTMLRSISQDVTSKLP